MLPVAPPPSTSYLSIPCVWGGWLLVARGGWVVVACFLFGQPNRTEHNIQPATHTANATNRILSSVSCPFVEGVVGCWWFVVGGRWLLASSCPHPSNLKRYTTTSHPPQTTNSQPGNPSVNKMFTNVLGGPPPLKKQKGKLPPPNPLHATASAWVVGGCVSVQVWWVGGEGNRKQAATTHPTTYHQQPTNPPTKGPAHI